MKSKLFLIIFVLLILFLDCCKKDSDSDKNDYRMSYTGDFSFKVINKTWWLGQDSIYYTTDTICTSGNISLFRVNQLLIKYNTSYISGIWNSDTVNCSSFTIAGIEDSLINNPPQFIGNNIFFGYYDNWASPVFHKESILEFPCIPFRLSGGVHLAFGGFYINRDSLYLFYSDGGLGAGYYRYIFGNRISSKQLFRD